MSFVNVFNKAFKTSILTNQCLKCDFSTTSSLLTRTRWSYIRKPKNMPRVHLPEYLLDREITRNPSKGGRGPHGKIIRHHIGGGVARNYRIVDHVRMKLCTEDEEYKNNFIHKEMVVDLCYDPNRTAKLAKVIGSITNKYKLIIAAEGMQKGDVYSISRGPPLAMTNFKIGDTFPIKYFPIGSKVFNVESRPGEGKSFGRSAGVNFIVSKIEQVGDEIKVVMQKNTKKKSKKTHITVDGSCMATFGQVSNSDHCDQIIGKAGRNRLLNRRPRGVVGYKRHFNRKTKPLTSQQKIAAKIKFFPYIRSFRKDYYNMKFPRF